MFLKTVLADGTAEQTVIREMKARAAGARGDIEQIVRGVMADVQERGWDAVVEYAEKFDGKAPYIVEPSVLDAAYDACDPKLISALEKGSSQHPRLSRADARQELGVEALGRRDPRSDRAGTFARRHLCAGRHGGISLERTHERHPGQGRRRGRTHHGDAPTENMSNEVLAAAKIAGVDKVIAIGGTQAIAALTYGAGFIPQVDKIVGPGNAFVAAAKSSRSVRST